MKSEPFCRVGECEIYKVPEMEASLLMSMLYPDQPLDSGCPDNLVLSVHSWIVRTPNQTIVIDTASGNGRDRPGSPLFHQLDTPYLQRFRETGIDPDDVDTVLITHLHGDHVGWNTHLVEGEWVPLFRNARYYCSESGLTSWQNDPARQHIVADSFNPVIAAGLLETIDITAQPVFAEVLRYVPTPGHSHDHASIILHSGGEYALFTGDLMHNEIQVSRPHLASRFCADAAQAEVQRRWAMNWAADHQALWLSSHFAQTSAGYVTRHETGFDWQFI